MSSDLGKPVKTNNPLCDGFGTIDYIDKDRAVIDDREFYFSSKTVFVVDGKHYSTSFSFQKGTYVGYVLKDKENSKILTHLFKVKKEK